MNNNVEKLLFTYQDKNYKEFHQKLMPTINPDSVVGVRIPVLRKIAKEMKNQEEINVFMNSLPHKYYEEKNLHAFLIEKIRDFDSCIEEIERFLPYVDNWATCDSLRPRCFLQNKTELLGKIKEWIKSSHTYTIRFAIENLMLYFLDEDFKEEYFEMVLSVKSDEYYVNMMISWYFATALAKQYERAVKIIENKKLSMWVHNKTIQKAVESYRIDDKTKEYLKSLKYKKI